MPKVFHRGRDDGKRRRCYWFNHVDANGKRSMKKGFTDKGKTEELANKLQHEADLRRRGLIDPEKERSVERKLTPLSELLAAFQKKLEKNSPKHVKLVMSRVRPMITGCSFVTAADINSEAFETFLREWITKKKLGPRTYNHYLQANQQFSKYLVKTRYLPADPLISLEPLNTQVDIRHPRRALSPTEFAKLVQSARESGVEIQCFDGETRARIYVISYLTGLRRNEIGSLTPGSFDLESNPPTVTVEAAFSKHRRRDVLPLHPELVMMLKEWLKGTLPDEVLFPELGRRRTWLMVKKDLKRVGIEYRTKDGVADFHAAGRHTHITELLRNGASLPEAKELARHTDVRQTMKYTHIGIEDQAKAIRRLPWHHNGIAPGVPNSPVVSSRGTKKDSPKNNKASSRSARARTCGARKGQEASPRALTDEDADRVRFPPPPLLCRKRQLVTQLDFGCLNPCLGEGFGVSGRPPHAVPL